MTVCPCTQLQDAIDEWLTYAAQCISDCVYIKIELSAYTGVWAHIPWLPAIFLARQFHTTFEYLNTAHDFVPLNETQTKASDPCVHSDTAAQFTETQHALSKQLIEKTKHVEAMIDALPGVFETEAQQLQRLAELQAELERLLAQKRVLCAEKEQLQKQLDHLIMCFSSRRNEIFHPVCPSISIDKLNSLANVHLNTPIDDAQL
ncbi:hypothetical protein PMAC_003240 [Pneumocystis sp. 'macacae']|nr:hypothetical protein PMAC_003240 [Pneumocystis sp. 'macacae']